MVFPEARRPERGTQDYVRNGTTNLYAALDVASGRLIADMPAPPRTSVASSPSSIGRPRASRRPRRFGQLLDARRRRSSAGCSASHPSPCASCPPTLKAQPRRALVAELSTKWIKRRRPPVSARARRLHTEPGSPAGAKTPGPSSRTRPPKLATARFQPPSMRE